MLRIVFTFLGALLLCFTTLNQVEGAPVSVTPSGLAIALPDGEEQDMTLTIQNETEQDLTFTIRARFPVSEEEEELHRDDRGGPDEMDYEWRDSDEDDCPAYQWIDILDFEDVVEVDNLLDDSFHGMFELGFEFEYYGEVYEEIGLYTNGWASFVEANDIGFYYPQWAQLPRGDGAEPIPVRTLLAVNYQDLNPAVAGEIYYWTNGEDMAVITWHEVAHFADANGDGNLWTFQLVITANGLITYQYAEIGDYDNDTNLIGLQNEDRDLGFTVISADFDYLVEEWVVAFGSPDAWIRWLEFDPVGGEIAADQAAEVELTIIEDELEDEAVNYAEVVISFNDPDIQSLIIPLIVSKNYPVGTIVGTITDEADDNVIQGALINAGIGEQAGLTRVTDEDGEFRMPNMPVGEYWVVCTHEDYFDSNIDVLEVEEGEDNDASMSLFHAECNLDPENITAEVAPGESVERGFSVSNDGNATLTYTTERRLPGGADADPWDLRTDFMVGENQEDTKLKGILFINNNFYVSSDGDNNPIIYRFDRDMDLLETIEQPTEENRGMKDLTFDGNLIWSSIGDQVIGMTLGGEIETSFDSPVRPASCITWDPDRQLLWLSSTTSNIFGYTREGEERTVINRDGLRMYGFAYWPDDPDDMPLYVYHKEVDSNNQTINKFNLDEEEGGSEFVRYLEPEAGGSPVGAFITNQYDIYSWVFMNIVNNSPNDGGDRLDIWQLESRRDWFVVDPDAGEIEAGDSQDFLLTLDAAELPPLRFRAEIAFVHDGFDGETVLPITFNVVEGPVHSERTLDLALGWSMVSTNLQPDEDDVVEIMADLVDQDILILMKNGVGQFYNPEYGYNSIPGWEVSDGYLIKTTEAAQLTLEGTTVMSDDPIDLVEGWQMISYFPRDPVDAIIAFSGLGDHLIMAKDGIGRFYNKEYGYSNMGDLSEGNGYLIKVDADVELVYRLDAEEENQNHPGKKLFVKKTAQIPTIVPTGSNMSLLIIAESNHGQELAVYSGSHLVGSGVINNYKTGIPIWGDDPTTGVIDGAIEGKQLDLILLNEIGTIPAEYVTLSGENTFQENGMWVVQLSESISIPVEFGINSIYPNPFNNVTTLNYGLSDLSKVSLRMYDSGGRFIKELFKGQRNAGSHALTFNGASLSSGVYIVELTTEFKTSRAKLTLVK